MNSPDLNKPNVLPHCWGVGLSRTGTHTFCSALRILGYTKVVHNPRFAILPSLQGAADHTVALYYKYLDYTFPGSKFVLVHRDLPEWLSSMEYAMKTFEPRKGKGAYHAVVNRRMSLYEAVEFDKEKYAASYQRHTDDVRRYFAKRPGDLLEMNVAHGDGWELLCPFLGLPRPATPFPHEHKRGTERLQPWRLAEKARANASSDETSS